MSYEPVNIENARSYQEYLEENIEMKKIISKLENLLTKERSEKITLQKIHEDFKSIHDKTRKEIQELNNKLVQSMNDKLNSEKRNELEIQRQKNYYEKQKDAYEAQILKLSAIDSDNIKTQVRLECELNSKTRLEAKNLEIDDLTDKNFELSKRFELLLAEYETMKNEALKEIDMIKENHKAEIRELLFKIQILTEKTENSTDKEAFRELKNEFDLTRKQNLEYLSEINNLRREKEYSIAERNDARLSLIKEVDSEKLKSRVLEAESDRMNHTVKNLEYELTHLKNKFDDKNDEIKILIEEKYSYAKQLRDKEIDFETFKAEIKVLRMKIEERDKEISDTLYNSSEKEKQMFLQERQEKEELMAQIEDLSVSLKESQIEFKNFYERANEEIHTYKRDFYIVSEEKRNLQNRILELQQDLEFIREDYDRKVTSVSYLEKELASMQDRYRELSSKEAESHKSKFELESLLKRRNDELEEVHKNSNNLIKMLKDNTYSDKRMKDLIMKKEHYKNRCKIVNEKLMNLLKKHNEVADEKENVSHSEFDMN